MRAKKDKNQPVDRVGAGFFPVALGPRMIQIVPVAAARGFVLSVLRDTRIQLWRGQS